MQESLDTTHPIETGDQSEPDSIRRLLTALGEWGVGEVQGLPEPMLEQLEVQAMDAYKDVAAVA